MSQAKEMREQRCKLVADARKIMDSAETLDAEQRQQVDTMLNDSDTLKADIDRVESIEAEERKLKESAGKVAELALAETAPQEERATGIKSKEYRDAFWRYICDGKDGLSQEQRAVMVEGTNTTGGYAAPMFDDGQAQLQDMIIETMSPAHNFLSYATQITIGGEITVPVQNAIGDATWTAENADATEANTTFTQLKFQPWKATRIVQISRELLSDSYVDMQSFMAGMFGRSFDILLNSAFVNGDGSSKPTGVTDGSAEALTAASATVITFDELQSLFYKLKESYRANGTWLFNSTTAAEIRGLKADGRYIWEPSGQLGQPDTLLGRPVAINDDCEDTATGLKPILFGDLSYYWVTWREYMDFQRLDELYAVAGNVGLRAELRVDGQLTSSEAVKHIIMA